MNSQEDPRLHAALRSLRAPSAPRSLLPGVLAALQAQAALPWWQRPFRTWPLAAKLLIPTLVPALAASTFLVFHLGLDRLSGLGTATASLLDQRLGWVAALGNGLHQAVLSAPQQLPLSWMLAGVALTGGLIACTLATVAGGGLLARLARSQA
jgi:hypothetical protein